MGALLRRRVKFDKDQDLDDVAHYTRYLGTVFIRRIPQ